MGTTRFNLSEFKKVREEDDIPGNFTSVRGEYFIPGINKTAFYKMNGCMVDTHADEDLRELLASKMLDTIGVPHADIVLAQDDSGEYNNLEKHSKGCLSVNILKENENFAEIPNPIYGPIKTVSDFIDHDIAEISQLPNITPEDISNRKTYLARLLYTSAVLYNTDISYNNSQIIYNSQTGKYRNPESYDLGLSFISQDETNRTFFNGMKSKEILSELYKDYAVEIFPLAQETEKNLTPEKVNELLSDPIYNGFGEETKNQIAQDLNNRVGLVKQFNHNILEYGVAEPEPKTQEISVADISKKVKGTKISLKDKVSNFINNLKNKIIGKDNRDDDSRN